jgi:hypothetical protein
MLMLLGLVSCALLPKDPPGPDCGGKIKISKAKLTVCTASQCSFEVLQIDSPECSCGILVGEVIDIDREHISEEILQEYSTCSNSVYVTGIEATYGQWYDVTYDSVTCG